MPRPTLKDVAARAGVSVSTASYALNDASTLPLAEATKERVRRAADDLGYVPNGVARSLQARASRTIGVVLGKPLTQPRYAAIAEGLARGLREEGFRIALLDEAGALRGVDDVRAGTLDGLVFIGHDDQGVPVELDEAVEAFHVPFVAIDCGRGGAGEGGAGEKDSRSASVDFDYGHGVRQCVADLWAQGIRTLVYVRPGIHSPAEDARSRALSAEQAERPELELRTVTTGVTVETIAMLDAGEADRARPHDALAGQVTAVLAHLAEDPDRDFARVAILCAWGVDAETAYRAAHLVDGRIRVAALAAGSLSVDLWPGLTYSRLPLEEGGHAAARLIIAATRGPQTEGGPARVVLTPSIERKP